MNPHVRLKISVLCERILADGTEKQGLACVQPGMSFQFTFQPERFMAHCTLVGARMCPQVSGEMATVFERFETFFTSVRSFTSVDSHMNC